MFEDLGLGAQGLFAVENQGLEMHNQRERIIENKIKFCSSDALILGVFLFWEARLPAALSESERDGGRERFCVVIFTCASSTCKPQQGPVKNDLDKFVH